MVPAAQSTAGETSTQPYPEGSTTKACGQPCQPTFTHEAPSALGLVSSWQVVQLCEVASKT